MNQPLTKTDAVSTKIEAKLDTEVMGDITVSNRVGGIAFNDMAQVMEFSKLMSLSKQAVPKHLRDQPGMCLALTLQALNWRMDPFAVANKSYAVSDRLSYEAQLIHAIIEQRAPIKGRLKCKYEGEGQTRQCIVSCISSEDDDLIEYTSPEISKIKVKNSPLWAGDPDQQLWYYSSRAFCRRHFPDVLLGVYEKEEVSGEMRDVTPDPERKNLAQRLQEQDEVEPKVINAEIMPDEDVEYSDSFVDPLSQAYTTGLASADRGIAITGNPYKANPEYSSWIGGWNASEGDKNEPSKRDN